MSKDDDQSDAPRENRNVIPFTVIEGIGEITVETEEEREQRDRAEQEALPLVERKPKSKAHKRALKVIDDERAVVSAATSTRTHAWRREIMGIICRRVSGGESMHKVCSEPGYPDRTTILQWVADDGELHLMYRNALAMRAEKYADEIVELANEARGKSNDEVNALKLMVSARQWVASRLLPKMYGDHQVVEHTGTVQLDPKQVDERLRHLMAKLATEVKR